MPLCPLVLWPTRSDDSVRWPTKARLARLQGAIGSSVTPAIRPPVPHAETVDKVRSSASQLGTGKAAPQPIGISETRHMTLKHFTVGIAAAMALALAGGVMAESAKEKAAIAGAVKADQAESAATAEQNEANKLQGQADKLEKEAAAARAKAKADPTEANKHAAEVKTKEAVGAAGLAGDMEEKAAAKAKAAESGKK